MKRVMFVVFSLLLTPSLFADAGSRLIPAGSLVSCTTGDGKISSKTTAVGDPILCKVGFRRGDFMLPYGSYLGGQFAEYKDPGHFLGVTGHRILSFGDHVINSSRPRPVPHFIRVQRRRIRELFLQAAVTACINFHGTDCKT